MELVDDYLLLVLTRKREGYIERWIWIWPLAEIDDLQFMLVAQCIDPAGCLDRQDCQ